LLLLAFIKVFGKGFSAIGRMAGRFIRKATGKVKKQSQYTEGA